MMIINFYITLGDKMTFRELQLADETIFNNWIKDWKQETKKVSIATSLDSTFSQYLINLEKMKTHNVNHLVKATNYFFIEDNIIKGGVSARWDLNDHLLKFGGHIGYGVSPAWRKQGVAKQMLKLTLAFYKARHISPILITAEIWNTASRKTIESNGGILENIVNEPDTDKYWCRYWVDL